MANIYALFQTCTQVETKMFEIFTRFQTKTAQTPYPLGWHIPISVYIGEHPPGNFRLETAHHAILTITRPYINIHISSYLVIKWIVKRTSWNKSMVTVDLCVERALYISSESLNLSQHILTCVLCAFRWSNILLVRSCIGDQTFC